jgi:hypothetical protein
MLLLVKKPEIVDVETWPVISQLAIENATLRLAVQDCPPPYAHNASQYSTGSLVRLQCV